MTCAHDIAYAFDIILDSMNWQSRSYFKRNKLSENWYDVGSVRLIQSMPVVRIAKSPKPLLDKRAVKDIFKSFGAVRNELDGRIVTFPAKSVGKMLGQRGLDLYCYANAFDLLFRKSIRAWSETEADIPAHAKHRNIQAYHQYVVKFNDGDEVCYVRFTVREDRGGGKKRNEVHSSTVSRIVAYKAKGAELSDLGHAQVEDSTPFVDSKIALFFGAVNCESLPWWKFW